MLIIPTLMENLVCGTFVSDKTCLPTSHINAPAYWVPHRFGKLKTEKIEVKEKCTLQKLIRRTLLFFNPQSFQLLQILNQHYFTAGFVVITTNINYQKERRLMPLISSSLSMLGVCLYSSWWESRNAMYIYESQTALH